MLIVTSHAVDQYIRRVKPALATAAAREEVERLIQGLVPVDADDAPEFTQRADERHLFEGGRYLVLTEEIVFAVKANRVTTCLIDGGMSEEGLEHRRRKKELRAKRTKDRGYKQTLRGRTRIEEA